GYMAWSILTTTGKLHTGYKDSESNKELVLRDPSSGSRLRIARSDIEEQHEVGTLMPDGLAAAMSSEQRRDLIRFLLERGKNDDSSMEMLLAHSHVAASFPYDRAPLHPEEWPNWQHAVNRDRVYDFYAKEAEYFRSLPHVPAMLPEFPGLD